MNIKNRINLTWQDTAAAIMLMVLFVELLHLVMPARAGDLYNVYAVSAVLAIFGAFIFKNGIAGPVEIKIFLLFCLWFLLSRWANGDFYLFIEYDYLIAVLESFLFFAVFVLLKGKKREILLDIASLLYIVFIVFGAILTISVFLTDTYIHLYPENVWTRTYDEGGMLSVMVFSSIRLLSAGRFFAGWALMVYQLVKRKNIVVRIILALLILISHFTIALFHSRTVQIGMSLAYGMLALLFLLKILSEKKLVLKLPVCAGGVMLTVLLMYSSFSASTQLLDTLRTHTVPAFAQLYTNSDKQIDPEYFGIAELQGIDGNMENEDSAEEAEELHVEAVVEEDSQEATQTSAVDQRKLLGNWTFTGRTEIWESGIVVLLRNPRQAIFGTLDKLIMGEVNVVLRELHPSVQEVKGHMHNAWMQTAMHTGFPGGIMMLIWAVLILIKAIKVFFGKYSMEVKVLTVPVSTLLLYNMMEPYLFVSYELSSIVFYITAGALLSYYYEQDYCSDIHIFRRLK